MLSTVLLFVLGLIFLIKGGDWFVDGASGIAKRFNMPELLIGATVVSIGTTLPEVMVSASSAVSGHGEIAYGNAIGSIICNTSLIAAITVAVVPSLVNRKTLIKPVAFFFASAAFFATVAYTQKEFTRVTGVILLIIFVVYMVITVRAAFKDPGSVEVEGVDDAGVSVQANESTANAQANESTANADNASEGSAEGSANKRLSIKERFGDKIWFMVCLLVVGAALIAVGADLLVDNGTIIAQYFGVPESVIALTIVALGTSLPELVTAITSLIKGCGALSLGNVIGANLFNLVLVAGLSCTLSPFKVPTGKMIGAYPASFVLEIPIMLFVMAFLTVPALIKGELKRYQGVTLLIIYAGFCVMQFT